MRGMQITFRDFVTWAEGSRPKAAELIGIDKYRAHRLYHGAQMHVEEALAIERVTAGMFKAEQLIIAPKRSAA